MERLFNTGKPIYLVFGRTCRWRRCSISRRRIAIRTESGRRAPAATAPNRRFASSSIASTERTPVPGESGI